MPLTTSRLPTYATCPSAPFSAARSGISTSTATVEDFYLSPMLINEIGQGLAKAAQTTNAWYRLRSDATCRKVNDEMVLSTAILGL
mmetsp:Transcript_41517/g.97147  ORF Transcript_41517/g.97147 Transcript_41517/m.97147 type:complete len:86 (+) Transcript_41517:661-918(+)